MTKRKLGFASVFAVVTNVSMASLVAVGCSETEPGQDGSTGTPDARVDSTTDGAGSCAAGTTACGGACVNTANDLAHCGACGVRCAEGQVCSQGQCAVTCGGGTTQCGSTCHDTKSDPAHCGACGKACSAGQVCSSGQCTLACYGGTKRCGDACVDPKLDNANCGECGLACGAGRVCSNGQCQSACGPGLTTCGGAPSTTDAGDAAASDAADASDGADGSDAADASDGSVAAPYCANTQTDNANCGGCGIVCPAGTACSGGQCRTTCAGGATLCTPDAGPAYCASTQTDNANCGACGRACASGFVCSGGTCQVSCQQGLVNCGGTCIDPETSRAHCGATAGCGDTTGSAGVACDPGFVCAAGACVLSCPANLVACNGGCIDPNSSPQHCGASAGCDPDAGTAGTVCKVGEACVSGTCTPLQCGTDCWGPSGCLTPAGRCIQFTCRAGNAGGNFCDTCKGWREITYDQWMNGGYCADVIKTYRAAYGSQKQCGGGGPTCCGSAAACSGDDNAWHFFDGVNTRYVGPSLGSGSDTNCKTWDNVETTSYTRITACER